MDKHLKKRSVFVTLLAVAVLFGCIFTGGSVYGKTQSDSRSAMEQTATADPSTIEKMCIRDRMQPIIKTGRL